ncbi:MAG TPA: LPS export ABC transporter permease LptF [Rhodocyclaceae bacterium]|jgi:lipopolysaccharide export system permease protein|nr:LPS export ABC transporter permease LptF [Rhodocyclaceae bacterium]
MIYQRAAQREFVHTASAVFIALFSILLTTQLIRLLGQAAGGGIAPGAVMALLGFGALSYLPTVLSLTLFIAVLMTLSRMYRDSEMSVWFSSGLSLRGWVRPVLRFSTPILMAIFALSMFLTPWALSKSNEYRQRMDQRNDLSTISPGSFRENPSGELVFFVENTDNGNAGAKGGGKLDADNLASGKGLVHNVFVNSLQNGRLGVMLATDGHVEQVANGDRFIVLEHGHRYENLPDVHEYRTTDFARYAVRIETRESRGLAESPRGFPLKRLLVEPTPVNRAELLWRIGIPASALILALLAIPLAFVNPRAGRTNNLVFAILAFMIYSNLISLSQAWVARGKLPFEIGVWGVHVLMFSLLVLMFWRRMTLFSWGRLWR